MTPDPSPHRYWRLLPSEEVLFQGAPLPGIPRDRRWVLMPGLLLTFAVVVGLFSGLLAVAELPGVRSMAFVAFYLVMTAVGVHLWPRYYLDPCEYMITDRHVIWRRGSLRRAMDRRAITYGRIHWHRSVPGVGHLELVRAVPFGPLARKQRLILHNVNAPDRLWALIRDVEPSEHAGFGDVALTDRLDRDEAVIWGSGPAGFRLGPAEAMTAVSGVLVCLAGGFYLLRTSTILVELEEFGLPVRSMTWVLLFAAITISAFTILGVGVALCWRGLWGARADGSRTEYLLTDRRLLIRRGSTELSVDRKRIVDVAAVPSTRGSTNIVLILDGPNGRALDDNGALSMFSAPPRAMVPPVLYEVDEPALVQSLLLDEPTEQAA